MMSTEDNFLDTLTTLLFELNINENAEKNMNCVNLQSSAENTELNCSVNNIIYWFCIY